MKPKPTNMLCAENAELLNVKVCVRVFARAHVCMHVRVYNELLII